MAKRRSFFGKLLHPIETVAETIREIFRPPPPKPKPTPRRQPYERPEPSGYKTVPKPATTRPRRRLPTVGEAVEERILGARSFEEAMSAARIGTRYRGPRNENERRRLATQSLPILTTDHEQPLKWIRANRLTAQERQSLVLYWLALWDFLQGDYALWSDWAGENFVIGGYELETSEDFINDYANEMQLPSPHSDLYQEV
jgi:hypothetical protein